MKKIISILLVLTVLVNVIGFGFFNVHSEAVFVEVASGVVLSLVAGAILGGLSGLAADAIESNQYKFFQEHENLIEKINNHAIENGDLIQVNERRNSDGSYTYWIEPVSGLSDDEQEFVQDICDSVNNGSGLDSLVTSYLAYNSGEDLDHGAKASASSYAAFKSDVTNAFCDYVNKKALGDAFTSEMISDYQLDWKTGGVPTIKLPSVAQYMESTYSGYTISTPIVLERDDGYFMNDNLGSQFGCTLNWFSGNDKDGYKYEWKFDTSKGAYGYGAYIIYNNKLYFCGRGAVYDYYTSSQFYSDDTFTKSIVDRGYFVSADGENLKDVYNGSIAGLRAGLYFVKDKNNPLNPSITINGSDLETDVGGGVVGIPLTDDEQTVAAAMSLPILSADPVLTIGSDGKITAVDGIDTSTLEGIVDNIAENGDEISFANNKEA
ncbi:MAG: hypothetical protein IK990_18790, partial [Ruminiclostridium sp.]|nr:hypothetical protein [Ruminiclostridium sp.]